MAEPIYHLFIVHGFREAYYQLSNQERERFWAKVGDTGKAAGAKVLVACDSRWCNEAYPGWGVEEYPNIQAAQKAARANEENQHFRYIQAETCLGTKFEGLETSLPDFPDPLYQLFLVKNLNNDPWESLLKEERDRIWSRVEDSIRKHAGVPIIGCDATWSNEEYAAFGVIAWPSLEAEQAHFKDLAEIGWHRYTYARTILGTKME